MVDVFISYSTHNRPEAQELAGIIQEQGFSVWWDRELFAGEEFRKRIRAVLEECKVAIVIWTETSIESDWVLAEASAARKDKKLIPVRADDLDQNAIPFPFTEIHTIPLSDVAGLLNALRSRLAANGQPQVRSTRLAADLLRRWRRITRRVTWRTLTAAALALGAFGFLGLSYADWRRIRDSVDARDFEAYLVQYPVGLFTARAHAKLAGTTEWRALKGSRNTMKLKAYADSFPTSIYAQFARLRSGRLQEVESGAYSRVLAESSTRLLSADEVGQNELTCQKLWRARNEIYYSLGRCFLTENGINEFNTKKDCPYESCKTIDSINAWVSESLTAIEKKNIETIVSYEKEKGCLVLDVPGACQRKQ